MLPAFVIRQIAPATFPVAPPLEWVDISTVSPTPQCGRAATPGQSGEQAKVQRQGAEAPKNRQDSVHVSAMRDASGDDQPSEPPTDFQTGILAVLFRVFATWHGAFGYSPDCPGGNADGRRVDFTAPAAPAPAPVPVRMVPLTFIARFTTAEQTAIVTAAEGNAAPWLWSQN
jgi:hypothetical protein